MLKRSILSGLLMKETSLYSKIVYMHRIFFKLMSGRLYPARNIILLMLLLVMISRGNVIAQNDLEVLGDKWLEYSDASNSLYHYLAKQAYVLLRQRSGTIDGLTTPEAWKQRQKYVRETLFDIAGPFPGKTPLNAKIVRTITREKYRVEHIIFESQPGFYVTSSLFLPIGLKKGIRAPAVLYCSGHSADGYRSEVYQHVILNLVNKGFIVLAFDPVGQGERLEYFDPEKGVSIIGGPTMEHSYPGAQAFITGSSQAMYMIWDGIRAIDYLLTRQEVDPGRLGITGRSGGGTQTAYIAAIDDRIYAAAPENYITNYTRLLQTIGPQDAEQNMFNLIHRGLDHPDFLEVRAPKPALMITTSGDMFSIQGAIETEKEVALIYKAYGREENFSRVEDDAGHASTPKNREAMYAFFQKHLNNPGDPRDEDVQILSAEELQVTSTGQVSTSLGGETVFSLNSKVAEKLAVHLDNLRSNPGAFLPGVTAAAKRLSGYHEPSAIEEPVFTGRIIRDNYVIEKYFVKGEGDYVIPYLLFRPDNPGKTTLIYLHPSGKNAEALKGDEIERFVNEGITVLAPDLIGTGETGPGSLRGDAYFDGVSHNMWYTSMLIGRSITGIRAGDVVRLVSILGREGVTKEIYGFARKEMAPVLLYAAAFSKDIKGAALVDPYSSYLSIVMNRYYSSNFIPGTVPGALREFDLPDLAATIAPARLFISGATDGSGNTRNTADVNRDLEIIKKAFLYRNANENLTILTGDFAESGFDRLLEWIK
jgi:pimeloyl-ACP methyl ester carboxylesterase